MSGHKRSGGASSSPKKRPRKSATAPSVPAPAPAPSPSPAPSASSVDCDLNTENARLESSRDNIIDIVKHIHDLGFTLDTFLHDLCYGNPLARNIGSLRKARRDLRSSNLLPKILDNLHTTPRTGSGGQQAPGAVEPLESWATQMTEDIYRKELVEFSKEMQCDVSELVNEETLKELTFESILDAAKNCCPRLMSMLSAVAEPKRKDEGRRSERDSMFCVVQIISSLSYQISQRNNRTQMFTAIYLKAKNAPKSIYTMLQHAGLSLSYTWAEDTLKSISKQAMEKMIKAYEDGACILIYDNFRVPYGIKHQRMDNLTVTDNGTTATLVSLPPEATALLNDPSKFVDQRKDVKERYMNGTMRFLEPRDFHQSKVDERINNRLEYNILAALCRIPEIAELKLEVLNNPLLQPPPPVDPLPVGKEHISKQHMFGTMDSDESTLAGGDNVQGDMLGQLDQKSPEKQKKLGTSRMQYIVGDNLTHVRGLSLQQLKQTGLNSFDRSDWIIWAPGWFHLLMNFGRAIYFEHYGSSTGLLLARDVATLGWSGLTQPTRNKGPDFHTLDEALHIILEARTRGLWLWATGTSSIAELVNWMKNTTAVQLKSMMAKIWNERASQRALYNLKRQKTQTTETIGRRRKTTNHNEDQVLEASIQLQHDLMLYEETRRAMRYGDVGQMDYLLPRLLMCFAGSKRWNYVREILNLLQWQWNEAPQGFAEATRKYAWLVNFNGEPDGFYAHDLRQELNNLTIRLNGPSPQSSTWKRHREIAPAMPILSAIVDQYDRRWSKFYASRQHYVRDAHRDMAELVERHRNAKIFDFDGTRKTSASNITRNILDEGQQLLMNTSYLDNYARDRQTQYGLTNTLELYEADGATISDAIDKLRNVHNPEADSGISPDDSIMEPGSPAEGADGSHMTPRSNSELIESGSDDPHSLTEGKEEDDGYYQGILEDQLGENMDTMADALYALQLGL